jgi:hypothetical protein
MVAAVWLFLSPAPLRAYSLLTHEQLIDLTWESSIVPLLRSRYPGITPQQLEQARAYAYGGCVIQDIGYYPLGDPFFSDLTHYVRTGDFVVNLFRNAHTADQLAFAIGALSHYVGDSIGHSEATNLAVPVEFPRLRREYGAVVTYGEDEHAHVQTEFAFDINEIAHHRLAPLAYLRHVGLQVPTQQLAAAFYQTYGLSEDFSVARTRRINVGGYRFATRTFIPRIAYALTVLHRGSMPADADTPDFLKLQAEVTRVAADNHWDQYRHRAGIGTYTLAGLIFILPKFGPLKLLAIKGPTPTTEDEYVHSVNQSVDLLGTILGRFDSPHQTLANRDLDTGAPTRPGTYRLTDETFFELLRKLNADPTHSVPPGLKAAIVRYFQAPGSAAILPTAPAARTEFERELNILIAMPVSREPVAAETE